MRTTLLPLLVLLLGALLLPAVTTGQSDTPAACTVSENYDEAVTENNTNLLRLFAFLGNDGVYDGDPDNISLYYTMLQSIRRYYEDVHSELPDCAQPLNTAQIRAITAMQDVLGLNLGAMAEPERATFYLTRANQAKEHLNEVWGELSGLTESSAITVE